MTVNTIIEQVASKTKTGIVDFTNDEHRFLLLRTLNENFDPATASRLMRSFTTGSPLLEADDEDLAASVAGEAKKDSEEKTDGDSEEKSDEKKDDGDETKKPERIPIMNPRIVKAISVDAVTTDVSHEFVYNDAILTQINTNAFVDFLIDNGASNVDGTLDITEFRKAQYASAMEMAQTFEDYVTINGIGERLPIKLDEKIVAKVCPVEQDASFLTKAVDAMHYGKMDSEKYAFALKQLTKKGGPVNVCKSIVLLAEYYVATGNDGIKQKLAEHYTIAEEFKRDYLNKIANNEEYLSGTIEKINEVLPLFSIKKGTSSVTVDSLQLNGRILDAVFKGKLENLKYHVIVRQSQFGEYELIYSASNGTEVVPITVITAFQQGRGYGYNVNLVFTLHNRFMQRIAVANAEMGITNPSVQKYMTSLSPKPKPKEEEPKKKETEDSPTD